MKKINCWEFKKCGRQLGGEKAFELGVCPASTHAEFDGIHDGTHAGRVCWVIAGTMCHDRVQGTFAQKYKNCGVCDFYRLVREEEGGNFQTTIFLLERSEVKSDT